MRTTRLPLDGLHVTKLLQTRRAGVSADVVKEYADRAEAGDTFPPLVAYRVTDRPSWKLPSLVAGFHRHAAYRKAGLTHAEVEIREGTFAEAFVAGWLSNREHGARPSAEDKRHVIETTLLLCRTDSAHAIAERLRVSQQYVSKIRAELVRLGRLDQPKTVRGRDGVEQPGTKEQSNEPGDNCCHRDETNVEVPTEVQPPNAEVSTEPPGDEPTTVAETNVEPTPSDEGPPAKAEQAVASKPDQPPTPVRLTFSLLGACKLILRRAEPERAGYVVRLDADELAAIREAVSGEDEIV